jgi:hypothetical protein
MFNKPSAMVVEEGEHVINLSDPNVKLKQEIHVVKDLTQKVMSFQMLFLFLHLLERHIKGKKPLVDYLQSHVAISTKYLRILF